MGFDFAHSKDFLVSRSRNFTIGKRFLVGQRPTTGSLHESSQIVRRHYQLPISTLLFILYLLNQRHVPKMTPLMHTIKPAEKFGSMFRAVVSLMQEHQGGRGD